VNTKDLITNLSEQLTPISPLKKPRYWIIQFVVFTLIYCTFIQFFLGFRSDISQKFSEPLFAAEIILMILLAFSCLLSSSLMLYPDNYQKPYLLRLPYVIFSFVVAFFIAGFFLQNDSSVLTSGHDIECSIAIAAISTVPSFYLFYVLRKGSNINSFKAGALATISASIIGCIALRICEPTDSIAHIIIWHHLPILIFSAIGAIAGKAILKEI
jgi:hypothetical protein